MSDAPNDQDVSIRAPNALFLRVEHTAYVALGILLCITAATALVRTAIGIWQGVLDWSDSGRIFEITDQLLFVFMLVEILHTVRVSIRSGALSCEPFLVVGLIACIRRVLVITLETSQTTKGTNWTPDKENLFRSSMIELGVLAMLILVMVISIYLIRRTGKPPPE